MKQDDIIRMAREAGLHLYVNNLTEEPYALVVERFAKLVAEHEREACEKVCEDASTPLTGEILTDGQWAAKVLAGKIRARGTT